LKLPPAQFIKTLIFLADGKPVAVMVRGDHEVNETKVQNALGATELLLASPEKVMEVTGCPVGFAGPVGLKGVKMLADEALKDGHDYVVGGRRRTSTSCTSSSVATATSPGSTTSGARKKATGAPSAGSLSRSFAVSRWARPSSWAPSIPSP
jgi:prolyl-tRNA editing enzyme YbaK/EbsC (Cys-tRNA(Pro) deacylase)